MAQDFPQPDQYSEFERLEQIAQWKRGELALRAQRRSKRWRLLSFLAGFLALLSAGSMTAIIAELAPDLWTKVLVALLSLTSGTITLLIATFFDEKETRRIWDGAAKFLALRDQALLMMQSDLSKAKGLQVLKTLREEYADYSAEYDHYIDVVPEEPTRLSSRAFGTQRIRRATSSARPQPFTGGP